jgi:hypothetical protein
VWKGAIGSFTANAAKIRKKIAAAGMTGSESARREAEGEDAHQHQRGAGDGVEQELDGRILFPPAPPDGDEHVHRHQLDLPEQEEEDEIQRREHAEHTRLQQQQPDEVLLRPQRDAPGDEHREEGEEGGQHHQRQADPVRPDFVLKIK